MSNTIKLLTLLLFVSTSFTLSAQSMASIDKVEMDFITLDKSEGDWSFYSDDENKTYFIDFEISSYKTSPTKRLLLVPDQRVNS